MDQSNAEIRDEKMIGMENESDRSLKEEKMVEERKD